MNWMRVAISVHREAHASISDALARHSRVVRTALKYQSGGRYATRFLYGPRLAGTQLSALSINATISATSHSRSVTSAADGTASV